ncbi:MAG: hypothetical protein GX144_08635 [Clostridiaceae bacterium]|jgi:hypothetical protein|nr:hypothetical protein [Clostridiaceae bacterium]
MAEKPGKDNTTMNEIADVLLDPDSVQRKNAFSNEAQFRGMNNRYQAEEEERQSGRHRENLAFQEWTAKYHQ